MLKPVTRTSWEVFDDHGRLLGYVRVTGDGQHIARVKGSDIGTYNSLDLAAGAVRSATVSRWSLLEID